MKCFVCNGTRLHTINNLKVDCHYCNGKGKIKIRTYLMFILLLIWYVIKVIIDKIYRRKK